MTFFLLAVFVFSFDSTFVGTDPIRRFTPADYNAAFQNWGIVQDDAGRLFSANTAGVLMYDGARWTLIPLPDNRLVRSIERDSTGRIWVGAENMIGHLEPDLENAFRFVVDSDSVSGDVWSILSTTNATYFQATNEILRWENGRLESQSIPLGIQKSLYVVDNRALIHEYPSGWSYLDGLTKRHIPELVPFNDARVVGFFQEENGSWLIVTRSRGIFRMEADLKTLSLLPLEIPEIQSARRMRDGTIAIGTIRNGIHIISADLKTDTTPGQEIGVHLDAIWAIHEDIEGHLWLGTDRGLIQMYRYTDLEQWDARFGLIGNIQAITRYAGKLLVGTSVGLYIQTQDGFERKTDLDVAIWDLRVDGKRVWIATADGIYVWDGVSTRRIGERLAAFSISPDVQKNGSFWVGRAGGLHRVNETGIVDRISGVEQDVRNIIQLSDGTIWAGTSRGGVLRVTIDGRVDVFLPSEGDTRVVLHQDGVLAGTPNGLYRWDKVRQHFAPWSSTASTGVYRMIAENDTSLWVVRFQNSESWLEQITPRNVQTDAFRHLPNRGLLKLFAEKEWLWVGTTSGLFRIDRANQRAEPTPVTTVVHSLKLGASTRIRYSGLWFEDPASMMYRFRLDGETEWSEWGPASEAVFLDLWEGDYRFEVESRNKYGVESAAAPLAFKIYPPPYRTPLAYLLYVMMLAGTIYGLMYASQSYSRVKTMKLEKLVLERTRQVNRQKEELIGTNRSLTSLIEQKNTILSIASHDLKNPLGVVQGFSELMSTIVDSDKTDLNTDRADLKEYLGYIHDATTDSLKIITDLLETAIAQNGTVKMLPKPFPVSDMAFTIAETYRTVAVKKEIILTADIPAESMIAFADSDRIQEVYLNIVSNAVKYTRIGGRVRIGVLRKEAFIGFRVRDEGAGFQDSDKEKMFELFSRLSAQPTAGERSNGIGLYIVKHFTELNGGHVEMETEVGKGSVFTIWIPEFTG